MEQRNDCWIVDPSKRNPVTSVEDERVGDVLAKSFELDDEARESEDYRDALSMSHGDSKRAEQIYPWLKRSQEAFRLLDQPGLESDEVEVLIQSVVGIAREHIDQILEPEETPGTPE